MVRRACRFLVKPLLFVTLLAVMVRAADDTGIQVHFIGPVASALSNVTRLPPEYVTLLIVVTVTWGLFRTILGISGLIRSVRS